MGQALGVHVNKSSCLHETRALGDADTTTVMNGTMKSGAPFCRGSARLLESTGQKDTAERWRLL